MRIAVFSWEALEGIAVGSGAVYASRMAASLARAGNDVTLFTRRGDGQALSGTAGGLTVRRCPWDGKPGFVEEISALAQSFAHYYREAVEMDGPFDVVHCHDWLTLEAAFRAQDISPALLAATFNSTEWGRTGVWPENGDSLRISRLEEEGTRRAECVISVSRAVRNLLDRQFHPPDWKMEVVHHSIDLEPFDRPRRDPEEVRRDLGIGPGEPAALFAGAFNRTGGCDLLAGAAPMAAAAIPGLRFIMAGEGGGMEAELRDRAGPSLVFVPPSRRPDLVDLYRACDIVLSPLRRDMHGRSVLPAWAAGKPVAALKTGAAAEFVVDGVNGWLVEERPDGLAGAVSSAFSDAGHSRWMGRNGRTAVEAAFTWTAAAGKTLQAYGRGARLDRIRP